MNDEWIYVEIARWISTGIFAYIGYRLGLRSQKIQALRKYVTEIVKDEYQALFSEIKRNSGYLENYLENPDFAFPYPKLNTFFDRGLDKFMERHHKDLFLKIDFFQKEILSKIRKLDLLTRRAKEKIFDSWFKCLGNSLPKETAKESERIASDLIKNGGSYYVLPELLNERYNEIRNKIEVCILDRTSHIYREKAKRRFVIRGQTETINFDEISQSLIEKAKPEIEKLIEMHKNLKNQNDREVKEKLLPLLQTYISKPI